MMFVPAIVYAIMLAIKALLTLSAFVGFICDLVIFALGLSPTYSFFLFLVSLVLQGSGYSIPSRLMWDK